MIISFDIAYTYDELFQQFIRDHEITILEYIQNGPAGGNPYYSIQLDTPKQLTAFAEFYAQS
jgi:hypothetical protein